MLLRVQPKARCPASRCSCRSYEKTKGLLDSAKEKSKRSPRCKPDVGQDKLDELIGNVATELGKLPIQPRGRNPSKLKNSILKLESFSATMGMVPAEGKAVINGFVKSQLGKAQSDHRTNQRYPGLGDSVKQVIEQLKATLAKFAS